MSFAHKCEFFRICRVRSRFVFLVFLSGCISSLRRVSAASRQLITLIVSEPLTLQVAPALLLGEPMIQFQACERRRRNREGKRNIIDEALLYKAPHYSRDKSNVISDASQNIRRVVRCTMPPAEPYN